MQLTALSGICLSMLTPELDPSEKLENIFLSQHLLVNIERQNPLNCFQLGSSKKGRSFFTALWNFEVASPAFAMIHYRGANLGAAQIPT